MDHDIYKPPQSELSDPLPDNVPEFYVVAEHKFLLLAIATFGMYYVFWFYKHWKNQKIKHGENIWSVARAIFNIFFTHSLFNRIQGKLTDDSKHFPWSAGVAASVFVLSAIIGNIADQISTQAQAPILFSLIGFFTLIPMVWSTYKAQQAANLACDDPAGMQNRNITIANIAWVALGLLLWVLVLIGLYTELVGLPPDMQPAE